MNKDITVWDMYQQGEEYKSSIGLTQGIPNQVKFYEGKQWPSPTEDTKNMPRPVINFIKTIVRNKKSGILSSKVRLEFVSDTDTDKKDADGDGASETTQFNQTWEKEAGIEELRNRLVHEGVVKGSGFLHYYWDDNAKGKRSAWEGGLRCELIDIFDINFSNPIETTEQKQEHIIIKKRMTVDNAKALCDETADMSLVVEDDSEKRYGEVEQKGSDLCTVLIRYFKDEKGEVFYERETKSTKLHKPKPLTPYKEGEEQDKKEYKAYLFPIVAYSYDTREKSIFGMSEVEQLIPTQQTVNFNYGMTSYATGISAWGKTIVKPDALDGQVITNDPAQVIVDHHQGMGDGIKKLQEATLTQMPMILNNNLISDTRFVTGTTEVMTGEQIGSNQSGASIAQLQSQALKPIEELRDRYWRACERGGKIVEMFFKLYYDTTQGRKFTYKDKDGGTATKVYDGTKYQNEDFDINVDAGVGTQFSEAMTIAFLEMSLNTGNIDYLNFVNWYPQNALPFKASLIKEIEAGKVNQIAQMQKAIEQQTLQMQQVLGLVKEQQKTIDKVDSIVNENRKLQETLANLQGEYSVKIQQANMILEQARARVGEVTQDATLFASEIDRRNKNVVSEMPNRP
jgi:hypothetical protein